MGHAPHRTSPQLLYFGNTPPRQGGRRGDDLTWVTTFPSVRRAERESEQAGQGRAVYYSAPLWRKDGECLREGVGPWCGASFFFGKGETASDRGGCGAGYRCCEGEFVNVLCCAFLVLCLCCACTCAYVMRGARRCVGRSLDCATATMRRREGREHNSRAAHTAHTAQLSAVVLG